MKLRVLMIGPAAFGGISALIKTLVPILQQQVDLLFLPTVQQRQRLPKKSGRMSLRNLALAASQYTRFLATLLQFHPDLIHIHTSEGLGWLKDTFYILAGKGFRCKVVVQIHASDFDRFYDKKAPLVRWYTRKVMGLANVVIAVSTGWEGRLASIIPMERVLVFRNCIAIRAVPPRLSGHSTNGVRALFLGRVGLRKGVFDLLEAMSCLKTRGCSLHLWIAGVEEREGEMDMARGRLHELHLEDTCELVGDVRGERKTQLLDAASLFVLPSYHENLSIAVLEAMASGQAIVTTPVGGLPEVIKDGYNGFLVPPGDVDCLAEKLARLANDPQLLETMGWRNREIAEKEFDVEPYANRLVELYESLA